MPCPNCGHDHREGADCMTLVGSIYATGSSPWCTCKTLKRTHQCNSTQLHPAHDWAANSGDSVTAVICPGVGTVITQ